MVALSKTEPVAPLTPEEKAEKDRLDTIIEEHAQGFIEVINALARYRDLRLYRDEFASEDEWLRKRHGRLAGGIMGVSIQSRQRLDQWVKYVSVVQNLKAAGVALIPAKEKQARVLHALPAEYQLTAWLAAQQASGQPQPQERWLKASVNTTLQAIQTGHVDLGDGKMTPLTAAITKEADEIAKRQRAHVNLSIARQSGTVDEIRYQGAFTVLAVNPETGEVTIRLDSKEMAQRATAGEMGNFIGWISGGVAHGNH